jgi:hypothetical protein
MNFKWQSLIMSMAIFAIAMNPALGQTPLGTSFTYQGELQNGGSPANGNHNLSFALFDAAAAGNQIDVTNVFNNHPVTDGLFTVELDFGAESFNGDARWLEIVVNGNTLSPRQPVNPAPYALQTRGIFVDDPATFVGVGRENSITAAEYFGIHAPVNAGYGGMYVSTNVNGTLPFYGYAPGGSPECWTYYDGAANAWHVNITGNRLSVLGDGYVGIGRSSPVTINSQFDVETGAGAGTYGGMYLSTTTEDGWPFYGYAAGGTEDCWTYYNGATGDWHVNNLGNRLTVGEDGYVGIGRSTPVTAASQFDVATGAAADAYGGMYITTSSSSGLPFYGYAAGGTSDCWTYYDGGTGDWIVNNSGDRLVVESSGQVGIATINPAFTLEVNGTAGKPGGGSWAVSSDERLKKDVADLQGALSSLLKLRGVTFEYKDPNAINELDGQRIGVIAQEVEKVFPDWVEERKDGFKTVTFRGFEALTIEALRELQSEKDRQIAQVRSDYERRIDQMSADHDAQIDELRQQIAELQQLVSVVVSAQQEERK